MRGRYHEHDGEAAIDHDHAGRDAMHEHWTNADGVRFVYYPHINRALRGADPKDSDASGRAATTASERTAT